MVEKILLRGESLPRDWGCDGTTGYDFMDEVSALQHDPAGEAPLAAAWATAHRPSGRFRARKRPARREIIARSFSAQLEACVARLRRALGARATSAAPALRRALTEMLVHFPVYRGYGTTGRCAVAEQAC